jgi:hypothetical protein
MTVFVFVSGPIRPSVADVIHVIRTFRSRAGECKVWVSTWETSEPLDELAAEVDKLIVSPQPKTDHLTAKTRQGAKYTEHEDRPAVYTWLMNAHIGSFLSVQGITKLFELGECADDDVVIRLRSDAVFLADPSHIQDMIATPEYYHALERDVNGDKHFDEWFGLSTYANMKKVWSFTTLEEHEFRLSISFNGEDFIRSSVLKHGIPIKYIDETKVDTYLLRPGGVHARY